MKMPASGGDPVSTTLRLAFSSGSKNGDLDCGLEASAKRALLTRIEYEPASNYQLSVLNTLKSKYIVVNTKPAASNNKSVNGTNVNNKKTNNITLPVPKLTLFPPERVQLGYRGNVSVGSGMSNMGNTCYLNSTLQALFHVPALINWLVSETAHQNCVQNSDYQMHPDDITCSVIKTFKCSQQKTGNCMKPISVYSKLKAICKHLSHGAQADAHEFMRYLLESLEKNYLTRFQGHKLDNTSKETTPINQIFGGYIRTEVVCLSCRAVSTTFQHFQDLPLDIRKASTLNDALAGYFERERLPDGEDAYKCEKCNKKVSVTKKFTIEKPPNVLCVQLKRFSMNGKITKQVQLPQFLDITRFISSNIQPRHPVKYKLVSMVTHIGHSVDCGHYTAIALAANGSYYQFDDSSVRQIPLSTVLNMSAYLILYEMERPFQAVNPRPFSAASVYNGNFNTGEEEETWPQMESSSVSNSSSLSSLKDNENKRSSEDFFVMFDSKDDKQGSTKPLQYNRPLAAHGTNGYCNGRNKLITEDGHMGHEKNSEKFENGDSPRKDLDLAVCEMVERDLQKKRNVVNTLLQSSHWGYGNSTVKSWNGTQSALEREIEEEKNESTKRSYSDVYNDDFDRGKVKKLKTSHVERDRPRYNLFQKKQQQQQQRKYHDKMNYYHWRGNNRNNGRYGNDFRNSFKRQPFNGQFHGNNNWNYSKRSYKFFKVPRSGRKGLGITKYFPLSGKMPGPKKNPSSG